MVRLYGLVKGYTPIKVNLPESGKVKVNIRTDLLRPAGKTIIGTLHLNGTTVYIPQDANITIGSSPRCDIRIKDPAVQLVQATIHSIGEISSTKENVIIRSEGKTGILTSTNEIKMITARDESLALASGDKVIFLLSGNKRLLPVEFKLRHTPSEDIKALLVAGLQPQLGIQNVTVEEALAKQPLIRSENLPSPTFTTLVAKTPLAAARNLGDALALYPGKLQTAKRKDMLMRVAETLALVSPLISAGTTSLLLFISGISVGMFRILLIGSYKHKLARSLTNILSRKSALDESARALAKIDEPARNKIYEAFDTFPPVFEGFSIADYPSWAAGEKTLHRSWAAREIKLRLPAALREIEPPALPLARKGNE